MKLWVIEVEGFWDERDPEPIAKPHVDTGRFWLFKGPCQWIADGWSLASDHNSYKAVSIKVPLRLILWDRLVVWERNYYRHGLPRMASFHLQNWWHWLLVRLPQPARNLIFWWKHCRKRVA